MTHKLEFHAHKQVSDVIFGEFVGLGRQGPPAVARSCTALVSWRAQSVLLIRTCADVKDLIRARWRHP